MNLFNMFLPTTEILSVSFAPPFSVYNLIYQLNGYMYYV